MSSKTVAILATIVNFILAIAKLIVGFLINSAALIAEGIHSGVDVFSSFVTFLGIRTAKKPIDQKHPYGYWRAESIAGLVITILLFISAAGILYEGLVRIFHPESVFFTFWAIILMIISIVINEVMARLKFFYGNKYESLSLVADAEHSRADAIASVGVLVGLFLVKYFTQADAVIAVLIGLYIGWEAFGLGKEITDCLLDVSNKDLEEKIKSLCKKLNIILSSIKTRKIGGANFAELKIDLDPKLKVDEATSITKNLEEKLLNTIPELKYVVISVESHEMKRSTIIPQFGEKMRFKGGFQPIELKKLGERTIIPVEILGKDKYEISNHFGVAEYMVIDKDKDGKVQRKEIIKNPYFEEQAGHGFKFAKAISAEKVIARHVGLNAQKNMEAYNIKFEIISEDKKLEEVV